MKNLLMESAPPSRRLVAGAAAPASPLPAAVPDPWLERCLDELARAEHDRADRERHLAATAARARIAFQLD